MKFMRKEDLVAKLQSIDIPDIETPKHKQLLRSALLNAPRKSFVSNFLNRIRQMPILQRIASTAVAAVVLFALFASGGTKPGENVAHANAAETLNRAFVKAVALSPEQRTAIEGKIKAGLMDSLEEAKRAKDLTYLTKEEFDREFNQMATPMPAPGEGGEIAIRFERMLGTEGKGRAGEIAIDPIQAELLPAPTASKEPQKYLRYTNEKGAVVYLGLDENDVPVLKMMKLNIDGSEIGKDVFILNGEQIGLPPQAVETE